MTDSPIPEAQFRAGLWQVAATKAGRYPVRTHCRDASGRPRHVNRLIGEESPYLLQHAHNPVDWYPWGEAAFAAARATDRPVFLSIGYSTCHWCHVMEEESFDNEDIAALLNQEYIAIKVDREQYPDLDEIYMTGVQLVNAHGGWPMSSFLLPDGRPFYGATYFPPAQFAALLGRIAELWRERRSELEDSAARLAEGIQAQLAAGRATAELDVAALSAGLDVGLRREDPQSGGLAGAPKFPQEPLLLAWLDGAARDHDDRRLGFVVRALRGMALGGLHDHVGGGFHRYSTDGEWTVPHFEKMLYNQSQLGLAYLEAYELTGEPLFRWVLEGLLGHVLRDMQLPEGGFSCATDADSLNPVTGQSEEGAYFVWTPDTLEAALGADDAALFQAWYDVTPEGNFEGATVLTLKTSPWAELPRLEADAVADRLRVLLERLRGVRDRRPAPLRDDKQIVAWSAAMATTLVRVGQVLDRADAIEAARRAVRRLWHAWRGPDRGLQRILWHEAASVPGQLEDSAALGQALLVLHAQDGDPCWLDQARVLAEDLLARFSTAGFGGLYLGPAAVDGPLLARSANAADGATVSPVALALEFLMELAQRQASLSNPLADLDLRIRQILAAHGGGLSEFPLSHPSLLRALRTYREGPWACPQYFAGGHLRLVARREPAAASAQRVNVVLGIQLSPEWHLCAPGEDGPGRPPQVTLADSAPGWHLHEVVYPAPSDGGGYRREVSLIVQLERIADAHPLTHSIPLRITLQGCGEDRCLAPETRLLRV